jgi:hypothetical protein
MDFRGLHRIFNHLGEPFAGECMDWVLIFGR